MGSDLLHACEPALEPLAEFIEPALFGRRQWNVEWPGLQAAQVERRFEGNSGRELSRPVSEFLHVAVECGGVAAQRVDKLGDGAGGLGNGISQSGEIAGSEQAAECVWLNRRGKFGGIYYIDWRSGAGMGRELEIELADI